MDAVAAFSSMVIERGDLDFTEQLWEKMRRSKYCFCITDFYFNTSIEKRYILKSILSNRSFYFPVGVTSYQDITDCLKIVIKAVRHGQIKPWVCVTSCFARYYIDV